VKYELPQLEPILSDTYGVIAYQEQVMRIASVLAGFTLGQSDVLRKAMGKKDPKVMAKQREAFMAGARGKGVNEKKAAKIFDLMEYFAGYGFNKSHSTAYAYLAYQTAYLKANYPRHFAAALLTIEAANTDKLALYIGECRDRGIPCCRRTSTRASCTSRWSPRACGSGSPPSRGWARAPSSRDPRRAHPARTHHLAAPVVRELDLRLANKRVLEALVKSGACDSLHPAGRARSPAGRATAVRRRGQRHRARRPHPARSRPRAGRPVRRRRGGRGAHHHPPAGHAAVERDGTARHEKEALGLYLSGHPLDRFADDLRAFGARTVGDLTLGDLPPSGPTARPAGC
jgi:DNA polymerase III subunit alpha